MQTSKGFGSALDSGVLLVGIIDCCDRLNSSCSLIDPEEGEDELYSSGDLFADLIIIRLKAIDTSCISYQNYNK